MARAAYAMLAFVTFTCYVLVVSATMEENAQEKTYTTPIPPAEAPDGDCPPPSPPSSPGSCSSWAKAHPSTLPDLLSFITPIKDIFAKAGDSSTIQAITSIFGSKITLHQGLTQTGTDGYSSLLRQGSAAILNSYTVRDFPYRPVQVTSAFRGALVSQQAASVMATKFENANLGYGSRH